MKACVLSAWIALAMAIFVPLYLWPHADFFARLPKRVLDLAGFTGMLAPLVIGAFYATGVVRRLEKGNPARPAWLLLAAWLGCFSVGEAILGFYQHALGRTPPIPSAGDAFFLLGYSMLIVGASTFVRVYLGSGLPVGPRKEPLVVAAITIPLVAVVGYLCLRPIASTPRPFGEAFVAIVYPVLDLVVLVPTAILVRITSHFHGGRVWTVWGSILLGFVVLCVADVLFAYATLAGLTGFDPLLTVTFVGGYALTAYGAAAQYELVG
jgi:hypothetical protein